MSSRYDHFRYERINVYLSGEERRLLDSAAVKAGKPLSTFLRELALNTISQGNAIPSHSVQGKEPARADH